MKIGICYLHRGLDELGGLHIRVEELIKGLARRGNEVILIQSPEAFMESQKFFANVSTMPIKSCTIDYHLTGSYIFDIFNLWRYPIIELIEKQVDILDTYDPLCNIPSNCSIPIVYSSNHFIEYLRKHLRFLDARQFVLFLCEHLFQNAIIKKADAFIVENNEQRDWLIQINKIPSRYIEVVLPGYDEVQYNNLQIPENKKKEKSSVLFCGRITRKKGVIELLQAFQEIADSNPDWELWFLGEEHPRNFLKDRVRKLNLSNRVLFLGRQDHSKVIEIVSAADIFVLPSYMEGVPLSIIEAMRFGKPVIATHVGAIEKHLIDNRKNGILVKPKDVNSLRIELELLMRNKELRDILGRNARVKVKNYTISQMVEKSLLMYKKLVTTQVQRTFAAKPA